MMNHTQNTIKYSGEFLDEFDLEEDKKAVCGTTLVLTLAVQLQHVV